MAVTIAVAVAMVAEVVTTQSLHSPARDVYPAAVTRLVVAVAYCCT